MSNTILFALTIPLALATGCGAQSAAPDATTTVAIASARAVITDEDVAHAKAFNHQSMLIDHPKLKSPAHLLLDTSTDGDATSTTTLVKDVDGRLFDLEETQSAAFSDQRYFILLDPIGVDWSLRNLPRVPNTRSDQILGYLAKGDPAAAILGDAGPGKKIVFFNFLLFVVTGDGAPGSGTGGFSASCAQPDNGASCANQWLRADNGSDFFDVN